MTLARLALARRGLTVEHMRYSPPATAFSITESTMFTNPYLVTMPVLEATLCVLYARFDLDDETREYRAAFARAYHDRTGRYFAARFY
jgi:hypothetical protein